MTVGIFSVYASAAGTQRGTDLSFGEDGAFRVMQITDTHFTDQPYEEVGEFIGRACDEYRPDLVVFTGDNLTGGWFMSTPYSVYKAIDALVSPVNRRKIPFAVVFGNHDWQTGVIKSRQMSMYTSYRYCVAREGFTCLHRDGNYLIPVRNSAGTADALNLWFVDSGTRRADDTYSCVNSEQIEWYERTALESRNANGGESVPAVLFQHIPVPEIYSLYTEVGADTPGALAGEGIYDGRYYLLDTDAASGDLLSCSGIPDCNEGQYDSWVETGDIFAAFFGHDHVNDYVGTTKDGITLGLTKAAGFQSRGDGAKRGVRVIDFNEQNVRNLSTFSVYYSDYFGDEYPEEKKEYDIGLRIRSLFCDILYFFLSRIPMPL